MRRPYIQFKRVPENEDCVGVSRDGYYLSKMRDEGNRYLEMLNRRFKNLPGLFALALRESSFGDHYMMHYYYDLCEESYQSSIFVEANLPSKWTDNEVLEWNWVEPIETED